MANHKLVHYAPKESAASFTFICNSKEIDISEENVYINNDVKASIEFEGLLGGDPRPFTPYAVPTKSGKHAIGFLITDGSIIPAVLELHYPTLVKVKNLENVFLAKQKLKCQ